MRERARVSEQKIRGGVFHIDLRGSFEIDNEVFFVNAVAEFLVFGSCLVVFRSLFFGSGLIQRVGGGGFRRRNNGERFRIRENISHQLTIRLLTATLQFFTPGRMRTKRHRRRRRRRRRRRSPTYRFFTTSGGLIFF